MSSSTSPLKFGMEKILSSDFHPPKSDSSLYPRGEINQKSHWSNRYDHFIPTFTSTPINMYPSFLMSGRSLLQAATFPFCEYHNYPLASEARVESKTVSEADGYGSIAHKKRKSGKRSWSRAVFSALQRNYLEKTFQQQKYLTKSDRRKISEHLSLSDSQVKIWFQNRRMKMRQMIAKSSHRTEVNEGLRDNAKISSHGFNSTSSTQLS